MSQRIELFYDFRSPYSYLALTQLAEMGIEIDFRPIKILEVMQKVGNTPTTLTCKAKGDYARMDLGRWAQRYAIILNPSDMKVNDGDACSRAVLAARQEDRLSVSLALYRALWSEAKVINGSDAVMAALQGSATGLDQIASRINDPETVRQLDENTEEAARRGVFGSPTMLVGDAMFFGNDRLDFLREELNRQESIK